MKAQNSYDKLRGGYYTPQTIADYIVEWAVRSPKDKILEPSCGDGSFLNALITKTICADAIGIELDPVEAKKAAEYGYPVKNGDFFSYYESEIENKQKYDVILGNPPFIRYQNFDEQYREVAFRLMKAHGFHPNRLTNIWLPFLLLSCEALSDIGRIGMVIPAELFQVDYAAEARNYLSSHFESLTLVTFRKLVFEGIQQEVIILLGEKQSGNRGIRVVELDGLDDLITEGQKCLVAAETKQLDHSTDKWVKYYLSNRELEILTRLNEDPRISSASDLYEVNVGLVSGENDFFMLSRETVEKWGLEEVVTPIIGRSEQVKGIVLSLEEHLALQKEGKRVFLFTPGDVDLEEVSDKAKEYIAWGESQQYNSNYKCRIRKHWYHVPMTWTADAFLIRQANLYPKMILNNAGALVTDTLHKVRFLPGINGNTVAAAFLNTYTLALSETLGRSYGGGVLTFEPGEMRRMRIPMICADELDVTKIDQWQREGNFKQILTYTDKRLLHGGLGLSESDISLLHSIWEKMRCRRLSRKQSM